MKLKLLASGLVAFIVNWVIISTDCHAQSAALPNTEVGIGVIEFFVGDVTISSSGGRVRPATAGDLIFVGDVLRTGIGSELQAVMADSSMLSLREGTELRVVEFQAAGEAGDRSWFHLSAGSLRSISGWLGKARPQSFRVVTPTATIGIRGTDHEIIHIPAATARANEFPGTHNVVLDGRTFLQSAAGTQELFRGQVAIADGSGAPRLLDTIPNYLLDRRGRFDSDFVRRKDRAIDRLTDRLRERGVLRDGEPLDLDRRMARWRARDEQLERAGTGSRALTPSEKQERAGFVEASRMRSESRPPRRSPEVPSESGRDSDTQRDNESRPNSDVGGQSGRDAATDPSKQEGSQEKAKELEPAKVNSDRKRSDVPATDAETKSSGSGAKSDEARSTSATNASNGKSDASRSSPGGKIDSRPAKLPKPAKPPKLK